MRFGTIGIFLRNKRMIISSSWFRAQLEMEDLRMKAASLLVRDLERHSSSRPQIQHIEGFLSISSTPLSRDMEDVDQF